MNNHPTNTNDQETFSFSSFVSGTDKDAGDVSDWKKAVAQLFSKSLRRLAPSSRTTTGESAARPMVQSRPLSRYELNVYGCPRVLSRWEVIVQALAWPVLVGIVIGYGLAISLVAIHDSSMAAPQAKARPPVVESQEAAR